MKILFALFALATAVPFATADEPKKVAALPPLPIDKAFDKAGNEKDLKEALLNDVTYKAAIADAVKAFKSQSELIARLKKMGQPFAGPSPAESARRAFLDRLTGATEDKPKE